MTSLRDICTGCFYSMTRFQQPLNGAFLKISTRGLLQIVDMENGFFSYIIHEDTLKIIEIEKNGISDKQYTFGKF